MRDLSVTTSKRELRTELRRRLQALDGETVEAVAETLAERTLRLPELAEARRVLICFSFGVEPGTGPLARRLAERRCELFVPRVDPERPILTVHRHGCELERLPFGLEQPVAGTPEVDPSTLDLAILVGLGFDRRGYRLGHGRGHFDRFLATTRVPAVGYAYEAQIRDRLPVEEHDVAMAAVVTEERVYRPPGSPVTPPRSS